MKSSILEPKGGRDLYEKRSCVLRRAFSVFLAGAEFVRAACYTNGVVWHCFRRG